MHVLLILNHKHNNVCGELLNILTVHLGVQVQVCPGHSSSECVLHSLHPYILQENKLAFIYVSVHKCVLINCVWSSV